MLTFCAIVYALLLFFSFLCTLCIVTCLYYLLVSSTLYFVVVCQGLRCTSRYRDKTSTMYYVQILLKHEIDLRQVGCCLYHFIMIKPLTEGDLDGSTPVWILIYVLSYSDHFEIPQNQLHPGALDNNTRPFLKKIRRLQEKYFRAILHVFTQQLLYYLNHDKTPRGLPFSLT